MRLLFGEYLSGLTDEPLNDGLLAQGGQMRDAVLADLVGCAADDGSLQIACAVSARAPPPPGPGRVQHLALQPGESAFDFVRRHAMQHDAVWLIAPETDALLSGLCNAVPPSRWLGCDADSVRIASSKSLSVDVLHGQGVLT